MLHIESYIIKNKKITIKDLDTVRADQFVHINDVNALDASKLD
jgi:hypothetical protein